MPPARQLAYLALKALNLVLATALSFGLVFALIRRLPQGAYATFILVSALGAYVLAVDLGFSSVVFTRVRKAFLDQRPGQARPMVAGALAIYAGVIVVAQLGFCGAMLLGLIPPDWRLAFGLYFLTVLLSLPWNVIRATAAGLERFMLFEAVEAARRLALVGLILAMTRGLPFEAYAWIALGLWAVAYAVVLAALVPVIGLPVTRADWDLRRVLDQSKGQVGAAGIFALCEVAVYNFPYVAIPLLLHDAAALVAFDIFYKITRFGASAYLVANEGLLPAQTRAIHAGAGLAIVRNIGLGLAISALPCLVGVVAVSVFGDLVFGLLLGDAARVPGPVRLAMSGVLAAMLLRAASGTLLLNTGKAPLLARISLAEAAAMGLLVAAAAILDASFTQFLLSYVAIFAAGSAAYFLLLAVLSRRMFRPSAVW